MKLSDLKIGEIAQIVFVNATGAISARLVSLGLISGASVKLARQSTRQQTLVVQVGTNIIALRAEEARCIKVRKLNG